MESSQGYYAILGVSMDASDDQIRRAYRKLAMQWHPDKWTKNPSLLGKAKRKFQQIQEAYSVLSDERKRSMYDAGLYDPQDDEDEGFADFMKEMSCLIKNVRKEEKKYSFGEIQSMFWEMAQSFKYSESCGFESHPLLSLGDDSRTSKRARADTNPLTQFRQSSIGRCETNCG